MANPVVQTSEQGMQAAGQEFSDRATQFTNTLQTINSQMAALQATWTGDASKGFNNAMDSWERSFQKVINELLTMLEVMGVTTKGYRDAEDKAANAAHSFASALPGI
ncbi:WXG100 family type VII secretion target [Nucisporomicrobium flavum]|uniref:WXG100 family type VII secretion target n=1 Tax=Nucisporomicrobium flavum TaxID=2785915 RepID=UPI0018F6441E|nr:WXG100 family type VII secretion target [Nucisporomicrobium flavum]